MREGERGLGIGRQSGQEGVRKGGRKRVQKVVEMMREWYRRVIQWYSGTD